MSTVYFTEPGESDLQGALASLGYLFWRQGRIAQAGALLDTLWLCGDTSAQTAGLRALTRLDTGDARAALDIIEAFGAGAPRPPFLLMLRARALSALGYAGAAREAMLQFLQLQADSSAPTTPDARDATRAME
ncbi:hypothetical protein [Paraburkholderia agricolaris]|nr:hypothetical protein [Paraburkholderia agricolaris]